MQPDQETNCSNIKVEYKYINAGQINDFKNLQSENHKTQKHSFIALTLYWCPNLLDCSYFVLCVETITELY